MSDQRVYDALDSATLILQVDGTRAAADSFKLSTPLAALVSTRTTALRNANAAAEFAGADATGAAARVTQAQGRLGALVRNGFSFIASVDDETLPAADREATYAAYLFPGGELGDLSRFARVQQIAQKAIDIAARPPATLPAAGLWPATTVARINAWMSILTSNVGIAGGGTRSTLIDARSTARDDLDAVVSRVRHWYCAASDDGEFTLELARIDMQPKRLPGQAQTNPLPDAPGAVTFSAAARTLTLAALPAHTSSLHAFRQPAGGEAIPAGVSSTATVSVVDNAPLDPGVTYALWVQPKNSRGFGPKSNVITFTA